VVTGCLAQDRPAEMAALSGVNLVVGNTEKSSLLQKIVSQYEPLNPLTDEIHFEKSSPWGGGISRFDGHQRATIKVQDGCHFGCSFCLIPRVRGEMVSRPGLEIVEEGKRLAANGVKELVLAGIQLSSYGRDWGLKASEPRLAPVIEKLLSISGIQRVRLSSYAVADFEDALLPLWASNAGLSPHLHLPLQSGDPEVLKAMRRPYTLDHYRATVEKVRSSVPRLGLTADVIAGFPGESEEAFENTLNLIREFGYVDIHPFPYSDRPDTPGEALVPKVNPATIRKRMDRLWEVKKICLLTAARRALGKEFTVIVERYNREFQSGLTDEGLRVFFPEKTGWIGKEIVVRVDSFQDGRALARVLSNAN